jgi:FkbM family methyltransferase
MTDHYVTYKDIIIGNLMRLFTIKEFFDIIMLYNSRFKNPLQILLKNKMKKYPISVILKNNDKIVITRFGELLSLLYNFEYQSDKDIANLERMGYPVKFYSAIDNGEIIGIFHHKDYEYLGCKGKDIIDIGANIGDSSIYFALVGANSVIALEPFKKNFDTAKLNIETNGLTEKIKILNAGCSSKNTSILVEASYSGVYKPLNESPNGIKIDCFSLDHILKNFNLKSPLIKIDCEGCEYDLILNSDIDVIKQFSYIQIEYHYGYSLLKKRLNELGFKVKTTLPRYRFNKYAKNPHMYVGWIFAQRTTESLSQNNNMTT